ncbi:MAG: DNA translocase FtsK, partial [Clostridia bacterium]|nr:DNA translocase FtsK [Clostridia bacterium]
MRPYSAQSGVAVIEYYGDAYMFGTLSHMGGGIMGSLLAYPAQVFVGEVGSYIFFTAIIIAVLLAVTKLSIHDTAAKVSTKIKSHVETAVQAQAERRSNLYTETLGKEEKNATRVLKQKEKKSLLRRKKQQAPMQAQVKNGELELMPTSGKIERKKETQSTVKEDTYYPTPTKGKLEKRNESLERGPAPLLFGEEQSKFVGNSAVSENVEVEEENPIYTEDEQAPVISFAPEFTLPDDEDEAPWSLDEEQTTVQMPICQTEEPVIKKSTRIDTEKALVETQAEIESQTEYKYERPPFSLMKAPDKTKQSIAESPNERAKLLERTFASFNIQAKVTNVTVGPVITRFELQPAQGVRVNKITTLSNDIALSLAASRVRIEAPIPGKAAIGIEVPNKSTAMVYLREIVENEDFLASRSPITFALGKDIAGKAVFADLDKMPHLLIAGSTGSGKSVCINDIIISMAYKATPDEVRMILVDPKVVELKMFSTMPHLLLPVVTDPKKAAGALKWAVMEMEQRYQKMSQLNARDLARYNTLVENPEDKLPKIVIVIDELADLMMVAAKDVEESICRIAQLGRASGIHLIVATQRPSTDVITGLIKANIPSRIAFMVSSAIDSRVILDCNGAEKLLGRGDMLFHANGANKPTRVQCAFIGDEEVESIMDFFGQNPTGKKEMLDETSVISASS